jgi:LysM repeat protein
VDRICPFVALAADHRTAVDGYDPDHACHAVDPPVSLDRARQSEQCLSDSHRQCDRYLAFLAAHAADAADIPAPSPDAVIPRTRLVVEPDARRLPSVEAPLGLSPRGWVVAGGVAVVGVAAAATAVAGGFGGLSDRLASDASTQASASTPLTSSPIPSTIPTPATATQQPTATPEPSPRPTRSAAEPTATPAPTTYVVQEGDTLNSIATQFGTTATAIRRENRLGSDVINIGQVLVIP